VLFPRTPYASLLVSDVSPVIASPELTVTTKLFRSGGFFFFSSSFIWQNAVPLINTVHNINWIANTSIIKASHGVKGQNFSPKQGAGVYGVSPHNGVAGLCTNTSGQLSIGVSGETHSSDGYGVCGKGPTCGVAGIATSLTAQVTVGVYGRPGTSGFGVYSDGNIAATGTKSFIQPHPEDPSKEIRFVCLEGNESGTYFRGSAQLENGLAIIEVPEEFRLVTESRGLTVQITPMGPAQIWVEEKSLNQIVVCGNSDIKFDYFVNGFRRGFKKFKSIHENHAFVPIYRNKTYGIQYPEAFRKILVDNGILNSDYTPNETTALNMGWELQKEIK